jgi:hypothetical protein
MGHGRPTKRDRWNPIEMVSQPHASDHLKFNNNLASRTVLGMVQVSVPAGVRGA